MSQAEEIAQGWFRQRNTCRNEGSENTGHSGKFGEAGEKGAGNRWLEMGLVGKTEAIFDKTKLGSYNLIVCRQWVITTRDEVERPRG